MRKLLAGVATTLVIFGIGFAPMAAVAASDADKTASQKATAECKSQVKQYAQYHETSRYERHRMLKSCIDQALAGK